VDIGSGGFGFWWVNGSGVWGSSAIMVVVDLVTVTLALAPGGLVSGGLVSVTHMSGWFGGWWI
jgi:hypothetical protein